jgi:hypothetical protein
LPRRCQGLDEASSCYRPISESRTIFNHWLTLIKLKVE